MAKKRCTKCSEVKSFGEFYFTSKFLKDGTPLRKGDCKKCVSLYGKKYQKENRHRCVESVKAWRKKNRFRWAILALRGTAKKHNLIPCNVTEEELSESFTGFCYVCGIPEIECNRKLCVDHNHETGNFRGWLCNNCNKSAGLLRESPEIILRLAKYVEQGGLICYG